MVSGESDDALGGALGRLLRVVHRNEHHRKVAAWPFDPGGCWTHDARDAIADLRWQQRRRRNVRCD
jgi:hypothetical protein